MSHPIPWQDEQDDMGRWWAEVGLNEQLRREYEDWLADAAEQLDYQQWLDRRS